MMKLTYGVSKDFTSALLLKSNLVNQSNKNKIMQNYLLPLSRATGKPMANDMCVMAAYHPTSGNLKKAELILTAADTLEHCAIKGIDTLIVGDTKWFEYLTGEKGLEKQIGKVFNCVIEEYEHIRILPVLSYMVLDMAPDKQSLQDKAFKAIADEFLGIEVVDEDFEFESYEKVTDPKRAKELLKEHLKYPLLASDIEATGLYVGPTELLTIAFSKDMHNAFTIVVHNMYGHGHEDAMHNILRGFFREYAGMGHRCIFHNGLYDVKHLVYMLFMDDFQDTKGMRDGINALPFHDTLILSYIKQNSTSRPMLGLKHLSYELLGDYGEDVKDATLLDEDTISLYNAKDVAGTWFVWHKCKDVVDSRIYTEIMEPSYKPLLKMMLNGMQLDLDRVEEVRLELEETLRDAEYVLANHDDVKLVERQLRFTAAEKYNERTKIKRKTMDDFGDLRFNPNSSAQLRILLFDVLGFEPIEYTKAKDENGKKTTGKTDRSSIQEFLEYANAAQKPVLDALIDVSQTSIILTTFLHAFETMSITQDGITTLHGNLKLGGTQSGRLSSSEPNLQNMPSGSKSGKAIKSCFPAPEGWLFAGSDFNALELRVGGILTKDKAVRAELLQDFDGHCVRTLAFFPEELAEAGLGDIDPTDPTSVNRIKYEAPDLRQAAKPIGFLKQYGGGASKIQQVLKCGKGRANEISVAYDELYAGIGAYAKKAEMEARINGYVECAFGLRLKTPRLGKKGPPKGSTDRLTQEQAAESRSSGNAKTQSYGMLTNRAFIEFDQRVEASIFVDDIRLISTIHDAIYMYIKNTPEVIKFVNDTLIECMAWQEDPLLKSDISLGAELDIGPSWDKQYTMENNLSLMEIKEFLRSNSL